jgi:hypothetical protein
MGMRTHFPRQKPGDRRKVDSGIMLEKYSGACDPRNGQAEQDHAVAPVRGVIRLRGGWGAEIGTVNASDWRVSRHEQARSAGPAWRCANSSAFSSNLCRIERGSF